MLSETTLQINTGLTFFTNYTINVTATNSEGTGAASNTIVVQTAESTPTAPLNLNGVALSTTVIRLVWEPPQTPNGIITRYTVYYSNGTSLDATNFKVKNISAPATTTDIVGLTPDTNYTFAISTTNRAAESPRSPEVIIATPGLTLVNGQVPDQLNVIPGQRNASINWQNNGICSNSISGYEVEYKSSGITQTATEQPASPSVGTGSITLPDLTPCTTYSARVKANCTDGTMSNFSNFVNFTTTIDVPSAPLNLTSTSQTQDTIDLAWMTPQECGDTVTMYTATYNGMSTSTMLSETTLQITGLTRNNTSD
jgi:hypothetical protein